MTAARLAGVAAAVLLLAGCGTGVRVTHPEAGRTAEAPPTVSLAPPEPSVSVPPSAAARSPRASERPDPSTPAPSVPDSRVPGPDLSRRTPATTPRPTRSTAPPTRTATTGRPTSTTIRIGDWSSTVVRGDQTEVDACRNAVQWTGPDIGTENGYELRTVVIVGHDYCGFDRFATLRAGTKVTIDTPRGTWTYTVYAHYVTPGRGVPAAGLYWGDLTLQSCVGPDTGFSYLVRD
ncbi:hypothetical protein [Streptomyces sp. cg40]|uniref:hypothetical protein n=1 Tax=Streptomyces sp. cg40 TaxID=3419764 RepID=UPI003CFF2C5E